MIKSDAYGRAGTFEALATGQSPPRAFCEAEARRVRGSAPRVLGTESDGPPNRRGVIA
jgi:hypothetical protein